MYLVAALKLLHKSKFGYERDAVKYTHLPKPTEIPTASRNQMGLAGNAGELPTTDIFWELVLYLSP
jgi:hypothetical protein